MSDCASVFLDCDSDASDALLLWIDPLGADVLHCSSSVDGFDRQAHKRPELDSRPHDFGFGEERPGPEQPTWLALAGATLRGAASGRSSRDTTPAHPTDFLGIDPAPAARQSARGGRATDAHPRASDMHPAARGGRGFSSERERGKALCIAPSDARTQGGSRSSATGADRGRSSAMCRVPTDVRGGEGSGLKKAPVQNPGPEQEDLQFSSKARSDRSPSW